MRPGSLFRQYLADAGLGLRDCAIAFTIVPDAVDVALEIADLKYGWEGKNEEDGDVETSNNNSARLLECILQRTMRPSLGKRVE